MLENLTTKMAECLDDFNAVSKVRMDLEKPTWSVRSAAAPPRHGGGSVQDLITTLSALVRLFGASAAILLL